MPAARSRASRNSKPRAKAASDQRHVWSGDRTRHISWPLGGIGAPLLALTGNGGVDRIAIRHRPDHRGHSHCVAALAIVGKPQLARVLEGPVPEWKAFTVGKGSGFTGSCGFGNTGANHHGLPRLHDATFTHRFPLAEVELSEPGWPLQVTVTAWSPFIPGDADSSGMPVAALEYRIRNPGRTRVDAVLSFHVWREFLRDREARQAEWDAERIRRTERGIAIDYAAGADRPWTAGGMSAELDGAVADAAWFRGGWFDALSMLWRGVETAQPRERAPHADADGIGGGASLHLPIRLAPGAERTATVRLAWHEPAGDHRHGPAPAAGEPDERYRPRMAALWPSVDAVASDFASRYADLRARTTAFADTIAASDAPTELVEAATATLPILRSPTVLRQHDGRLWGWEGSGVDVGSCNGSCTHVWNYAQALAHLFPALERSLRESEFGDSQDDAGHQNFRTALPIRPTDHLFHAAADGQLGGIVKAWREWQLSGDLGWLRRWWPRIRASLEYCIEAWDPDRTGALVEPHHNTYDIEFWGPDGMCGSFYAAALQAASALAEAVGDDPKPWRELAAKAVKHLERDLFRKGRFVQRVQRATPRSGDVGAQKAKAGWVHNAHYSPEARALLDREGPKYQYGEGCLSDGVLGAWMAEVAGLPCPLDRKKVESHLRQVVRHNLKADLRGHANVQRPGYALNAEGGLLLCTWPDGGKPALPFVYSDEVWTGIEHQVASHCLLHGLVDEALAIERRCRARYDGTRRNPFDEYECGHWYARSMASWSLPAAHAGLRYSAVDRTLWIDPRTAKRPYRAALVVGEAHGTVTLGKQELTIELRAGRLELERVVVTGRAVAWTCRAEVGKPVTLRL